MLTQYCKYQIGRELCEMKDSEGGRATSEESDKENKTVQFKDKSENKKQKHQILILKIIFLLKNILYFLDGLYFA